MYLDIYEKIIANSGFFQKKEKNLPFSLRKTNQLVIIKLIQLPGKVSVNF